MQYPMHELHENEQYFFDQPTLRAVAAFVAGFSKPCCICAPTLAAELAGQGLDVRILDIDRRFEHLPGFRYFDLERPDWLGEEFGLIVCDPPFFNVSLAQLVHAMRVLGRYNDQQPMMISYLVRRQESFLGAFARFGLRPTGYRPGYATVEPVERNAIEFYSNLDPRMVDRLVRPVE
jgi:hypothetical protein